MLRLGDPLNDVEVLLPRGGGVAFALDMMEPDGTPTILTGPVELVLDGGHTFAGSVSTVWTVNDSTVLPDGTQVGPSTPGAALTSRVTFTLTGADTIAIGAGQRRAGIRYTPLNSGPLLIARGLAVVQ